MYSKVTQNKIEKLCKRFCKNAKVRPVLTSKKFRHLYTKIPIHVSSLKSSLFQLAVTLVMLVKRTKTSQPGLMNTLLRIKSHIYAKA